VLGQCRRTAPWIDDVLRDQMHMNVISRPGFAEQEESIRKSATRTDEATARLPEGTRTSETEPASFRTLIAHAVEFSADFARYSGRRGIVAGALVALGGVLEGVGLLLLVPILAVVLDTTRKQGQLSEVASLLFKVAGTRTHFQQLALLLSLFTALIIFRALVNAKRDIALTQLQAGFVEDIRTKVASSLVVARWDFVARVRHARITHVMSSGIQNIGAATNFLLQCIVSLTLTMSQCLLAFLLSPMLACLALLLLALGGVALGLIMRRARRHGLFLADSNLTLLDDMAQFLGGMKLAVSQNLERRFIREFKRTLTEYTRRQIAYAHQRSNATVAATSISAVAAALIVLVGVGVMNVAASQLIAMLYLFVRMTGPALQIQHGAQLFAVGLPAYERINELLGELSAARAPIAISESAGQFSADTIAFRGVTFSYAPESATAPVLQNASLTIAAGSIVGLFGSSGEGKTTFVDLLVGLLSPQAGKILIGDTVLRSDIIGAWRDRVSYVAQDPFLFHDTIRRNLLWVAPNASEEDLWNALHIVGADVVVRRMANGLDSVVGERGTLVSGGERQRLALARAILRKPRLLILDEATNALDLQSEGAIIRRLVETSPRPSIIMIAHRIESVGLCDRKIRLEAGRFVEFEQ